MIQVVSTSADYAAQTRPQNSQVAKDVDALAATLGNSKTTKASEVASQAQAVNDKDNVAGKKVKEEGRTQSAAQMAANEAELTKKKASEEEDAARFADKLSELTRGFGLSFSIEKDLNRTIVTVTDKNTDEVIRQIPTEEFIKRAKRICETRSEMQGVSSEDFKGIFLDNDA